MRSDYKSVNKLKNAMVLSCLEYALSIDITEEISKLDLSDIDSSLYPNVCEAIENRVGNHGCLHQTEVGNSEKTE